MDPSQTAALLQSILDCSDVGILCLEPIHEDGKIVDYRIIAANKTNIDLNGHTPEQLTGQRLCEVFTGLKGSEIFDGYVHVSTTGETNKSQLFYDSDGIRDWFDLTVTPATPTAIVATYRNVSEQVITQIVRRTIIDLSPSLSNIPVTFEQGVLDCLREQLGFSHGFLSRIEDRNYHVRRLSGELEDVSPGDILPLESTICAVVLDHEKPVIFNDSSAIANAHPALSNTPFEAYVGAPVYVDGKVFGALCLAGLQKRPRDIEPWEAELLELAASSVGHGIELQQQIASQKQLSDELRLVLDNVPSRIWFKNDNNTILRANMAVAKFLGFSEPEEVEGRRTEEFFPEMAETYMETDLKILESNRPTRNLVQSFISEDGSEGWVSASRIPMTNDHGDRLVLVVATDITELKQNEQELQRLNDSLREFTQVAAHDLRAPLRQVAAFSGLLRDDLNAGNVPISDESKEFLQYITESVGHMRELVSDLYNLTTVDVRPIELERTDLNMLARKAITNCSTEIEAASAEVELGDLPMAKVSPHLIRQFLQNIIVNACKYAIGEPLRIHIHAEQNVRKRRLRLSIDDNGQGIPLDQQERIFQPFQRLHQKADIDGTGIGLAFCRKIARLHKGELFIDPDYTSGARFVLVIPY